RQAHRRSPRRDAPTRSKELLGRSVMFLSSDTFRSGNVRFLVLFNLASRTASRGMRQMATRRLLRPSPTSNDTPEALSSNGSRVAKKQRLARGRALGLHALAFVRKEGDQPLPRATTAEIASEVSDCDAEGTC